MDVPVYNMQGEQVSTFAIDEQSLGGSVRPGLIKQAYVMFHANLRQGSAHTRNRSEVQGSTRKIYMQKGTGRARHGAKTANLFRGGGHTFAKDARRTNFRQDMPKKMRRLANRNALLAKLVDGEVKIIDSLQMSEAKTKAFAAVMAALKLDRPALVALSVDPEKSRNGRASARNLADATLCRSDQLTAFELMNHRYVIIEKAELEAWLNGPGSQTDKSAKLEPMGKQAKKERRKRPYEKKAVYRAGDKPKPAQASEGEGA